MSIRLACPHCLVELTYPGSAAGKSTQCPKCRSGFRVPTPLATALSEPAPVDSALPRDQTPMPDELSRPKPRPVYKQNDSSDETESLRPTNRRSSERGRKRKKVRIKQGINPAVYVAGGILALALVIGVVVLAIYLASDAKDTPRTSTMGDEPPAIEDVKTNEPQGSVSIPPGWSVNDKSLGFVAVWPIKGDEFQNTPTDSITVGFNGTKPNAWSCVDLGEKCFYQIHVIDLLDDGTINADLVLDRTVEKLKQKSFQTIPVSKINWGGDPGREIVSITGADRVTMRLRLHGSRLWTVTVKNPASSPADDERVWRFIKSFKPN